MAQMNVLGIYGSPRAGGNSDLLLDEALAGAAAAGARVERIYVRQLGISGCLECGGCDQTGQCVIDDDMQLVYPKLEKARLIFMASPIFFYGLPAQLKALVDRGQAQWSKRLLEKNPGRRGDHLGGLGCLIAVGATKGRNLFDGAKLTAKYFFDALDMDYQDGLFYHQIEGQGEILKHQDYLAQAFELGRTLVEQADA